MLNYLLQVKMLKQLMTAAYIDQIAIRKDLISKDSTTGTKYATSMGVEYRAMGVNEDVFIHPSSVLANVPPPAYVLYHEIVRSNRLWIKGSLAIIPLAYIPELTIFQD